MIITNVSTGRREVGGFTKQQILDFPPPIPSDSCWTELRTTERCLRQLQQIYTRLLAEPDQDRAAVGTTSALIIALPELARTSKGPTKPLAESWGNLVSFLIFLHAAFYPPCFDSGHFENIYEMKIPSYSSQKNVKMLHLSVNISKRCYTTKTLLKTFWW